MTRSTGKQGKTVNRQIDPLRFRSGLLPVSPLSPRGSIVRDQISQRGISGETFAAVPVLNVFELLLDGLPEEVTVPGD